MIKGKKREILTMDSILSFISEYDVFRYYMRMSGNNSWKLNEPTLSPFRNESHPSFIIGNKAGYLSYIDFGNTNFRGDCFHFVKQLYTIPTINDVLKLIDKDFSLGISSKPTSNYKKIVGEYKQPENLGKRYSLIQVKVKKLTKLELQYWNEYYQDVEDLKKNHVYGIDKVYLNKKLFSFPDNELKFGYFYDGFWKIYRPFGDRKTKWVPNNVPITTMDGKKDDVTNCDYMFINKSKKDYMVMKKLLECTCAVQNEGIACFSQENVEWLKSISNKQILSFDADVTGVKNSQQITKLFDFDYCNVPRKYLLEGIKDWADLARIRGIKTVENYLKQQKLI